MNKLLIICGPTACGKTSLGVKLAKQFNGEIISADSRQVYQDMDIVTGKDRESYAHIPVWGLDLVRPDEQFSAAHWLKFAQKATKDIWSRKKLPIVVGGTGFWIKALLEPVDSMGIPPDPKLRQQLEKSTLKQLQARLKIVNKNRWEKMNKSDKNNPRRLIRAIEISKKLPAQGWSTLGGKIKNYLIIGLKAENKFLYQRIDQRVDERMKQGAQKEVSDLLKKGYSWDLPSMTSLGYREWRAYFHPEDGQPLADEAKKNKDKVMTAWKYSEHAYVRRQLTFFKKMENINWFDIRQPSWQKDVVKLVKTWYINNNAGKN